MTNSQTCVNGVCQEERCVDGVCETNGNQGATPDFNRFNNVNDVDTTLVNSEMGVNQNRFPGIQNFDRENEFNSWLDSVRNSNSRNYMPTRNFDR